MLYKFDNHDARLPYYELMLEKDLSEEPEYPLPAGYHFENFRPGDAETWIRIEKSAKEFRTVEEGWDAWRRYYEGQEKALESRMFFVVRDDGVKVATATDFYNIYTGDDGVNAWLHWVAVCREEQGRGLSKPLISHVIRHMIESGYRRAVIPTQTTTWLACKVYLDLGFRPIPKNAERNRAGWQIVRSLTDHPALQEFPEIDLAEYWTRKKVVLLNGPSSSGKSTLSKALQAWIEKEQNETYAIVSIDDFMKLSPDETIYEDDVFEISGDMCKQVLQDLETASGVIIDHVITSSRIFDQFMDAVSVYPVYKVHVTCPPEVLQQREAAREDRCPGSASASFAYLYPQDGYDLTVDTHNGTVEECARVIGDMLWKTI